MTQSFDPTYVCTDLKFNKCLLIKFRWILQSSCWIEQITYCPCSLTTIQSRCYLVLLLTSLTSSHLTSLTITWHTCHLRSHNSRDYAASLLAIMTLITYHYPKNWKPWSALRLVIQSRIKLLWILIQSILGHVHFVFLLIDWSECLSQLTDLHQNRAYTHLGTYACVLRWDLMHTPPHISVCIKSHFNMCISKQQYVLTRLEQEVPEWMNAPFWDKLVN